VLHCVAPRKHPPCQCLSLFVSNLTGEAELHRRRSHEAAGGDDAYHSDLTRASRYCRTRGRRATPFTGASRTRWTGRPAATGRRRRLRAAMRRRRVTSTSRGSWGASSTGARWLRVGPCRLGAEGWGQAEELGMYRLLTGQRGSSRVLKSHSTKLPLFLANERQ